MLSRWTLTAQIVKLYEATHSSQHTQRVINLRMSLIHLLLISWELRISHPLITHTHNDSWIYVRMHAVHKRKVWGLSLWFNERRDHGAVSIRLFWPGQSLHVSRYGFITQSICILTHSQGMHLSQSAAMIQNPSGFMVDSKKKVWSCHLCLHCCHV